jgi:UDP-glucuronate 4-epimerase
VPDPATSYTPWRLYHVGNSRPVEVIELVQLIEHAVGRPAIREFLPMQPGDVLGTCADSSGLERAVGFRPNTSIEDGTRLFVEWFREYRRSK